MSLRVILLRSKITAATKQLEQLRAVDFETRRTELKAAIDEAETRTDLTDDERAALEDSVNAFDAEESEHNAQVVQLEASVREMEAELDEIEKANTPQPAAVPPAEPEEAERKAETKMTRRNIFAKLSEEQRTAIFARDDVKAWIAEARKALKEKRAINGVGTTIPEILIGILEQNSEGYSKLEKYIDFRTIKGTAREIVDGSIPEAVWTECCANLNELDLTFNDAEVDCYKVGGFVSVCNASLEDSDIELASKILDAIGQSIGYAKDKAILFGRNTSGNSKMPLGIFSRLAQESQPAGYSSTERAWADLHSTHMLTIANSVTGLTLFMTILLDTAVISGKYARKGLTWVMNDTTFKYLQAQAASEDAAGAIVTAVNKTMPIIGGDIVILDFMPNYMIGVGYFENYLLVARNGIELAQSEHVKFLQDKTVFKGTQRMDGKPVIAEAFAMIGVNGTSPSASMTFASDKANTVQQILLNKNAAAVTAAAGTNHTVQLKATLLPEGTTGTITWASSVEAKATVSSSGLVTGAASGSTVITATCGDAVAVCNVTVS